MLKLVKNRELKRHKSTDDDPDYEPTNQKSRVSDIQSYGRLHFPSNSFIQEQFKSQQKAKTMEPSPIITFEKKHPTKSANESSKESIIIQGELNNGSDSNSEVEGESEINPQLHSLDKVKRTRNKKAD